MARQRTGPSHNDYLMCRTLGHAWFSIPSDGTVDRWGGDPFWLRCDRCLVERHDWITYGNGELLGRRYFYDTEYRNAFRDDFADYAPTRNDYRRMLVAETILKAREARKAKMKKAS